MYRIEYNSMVIYDDTMPNSPEYQIIDFKLSMAVNKAGSLTMTVPPTNKRYANIMSRTDERILVLVYFNADVIWHGRTTSVSMDLYGRLKVFCEGAMAWLDDALYQGYPSMNGSAADYKLQTADSKMQSILSGYIASARGTPIIQEDFRFMSSAHTDMQIDGEADSNYKIPACAPDTTKTCLQRLQDLQKKYGGYFTVKYQSPSPFSRLYWYANPWGGNQQGSYQQTANFGENLLSYARTLTTDNIFTVIRPYGEIADNAPDTETAKTNIFSDTSTFMNSWRLNANGERVECDNTNYNLAEVVIEAGKTYYYSGHMRGNFSLFSVADANRNLMYVKTNYGGSPPDNTKDFEFSDIEIPIPEGAKYIYACFHRDAAYETDHSVTLIDYSNVAYTATVNEQDKDAYRVTIADVNNGEEWLKVSTQLYQKYGWIERRVMFPNINKPQALMDAAQNYLLDLSFNTINIEVSFIDLAAMGAAPQPLKLFDGVRVQTAQGEQYTMYVTKIDLTKNPANSKITLGTSLTQGISSLV